MNYWLLIIMIAVLIIPIIISIVYYIKYKLVPAIYMNCWMVLIYLFSLSVIAGALLANLDYFISNNKMILVLGAFCLIFIPVMLLKLAKSIIKGIRLRLNRNLLLVGTKVEVNNLKLEIYKIFKQYYLGYYKGTYKNTSGKKCTFISEDYLKNYYSPFNSNNKKPNKIIIYVDPNNENNYFYKIDNLK